MRYLILSVFIAFTGCSPADCVNTNPIFDKYSPEDKEYREELANVVNRCHKDSIAAWIHSYDVVHGREYMYVNMIGRSVCAIAMMDITGNEELKQYRKVKGHSFNGAFLPHLKYHVEQTEHGVDFVLDKVGEMID